CLSSVFHDRCNRHGGIKVLVALRSSGGIRTSPEFFWGGRAQSTEHPVQPGGSRPDCPPLHPPNGPPGTTGSSIGSPLSTPLDLSMCRPGSKQPHEDQGDEYERQQRREQDRPAG